MARNYCLYELTGEEFENLVIHICNRILGLGTINFSEGKDGGRDAVFEGKADNFPSKADAWEGKFIIQAKRTNKPTASCSDVDFKTKILNEEIPKLLKLKNNNEIDNYLLFTTRKLTAGAYLKHKEYLKEKTKIENVEILGQEKITSLINEYPDLIKICNLNKFNEPLRIYPDDIKELIINFHKKLEEEEIKIEGNSRYSFDYLELEKKNELNNLSEVYFNCIKETSISYFEAITNFLQDSKNGDIIEYYYDIVDELKNKITIHRDEFCKFDDIFEYFYDYVLDSFKERKAGQRKFINVFLHYMYCKCDIGKK